MVSLDPRTQVLKTQVKNLWERARRESWAIDEERAQDPEDSYLAKHYQYLVCQGDAYTEVLAQLRGGATIEDIRSKLQRELSPSAKVPTIQQYHGKLLAYRHMLSLIDILPD